MKRGGVRWRVRDLRAFTVAFTIISIMARNVISENAIEELNFVKTRMPLPGYIIVNGRLMAVERSLDVEADLERLESQAGIEGGGKRSEAKIGTSQSWWV